MEMEKTAGATLSVCGGLLPSPPPSAFMRVRAFWVLGATASALWPSASQRQRASRVHFSFPCGSAVCCSVWTGYALPLRCTLHAMTRCDVSCRLCCATTQVRRGAQARESYALTGRGRGRGWPPSRRLWPSHYPFTRCPRAPLRRVSLSLHHDPNGGDWSAAALARVGLACACGSSGAAAGGATVGRRPVVWVCGGVQVPVGDGALVARKVEQADGDGEGGVPSERRGPELEAPRLPAERKRLWREHAIGHQWHGHQHDVQAVEGRGVAGEGQQAAGEGWGQVEQQ
eukprot:scaffold11154_cov101-Isochrysis_galbana.AAC.4